MSKATLAWLEKYPHRRTLWDIEPCGGFLEMVLDDFAATFQPVGAAPGDPTGILPGDVAGVLRRNGEFQPFNPYEHAAALRANRDLVKQRLTISLIIFLLGFSLGTVLGLAIQLPH